MYPTIAACPCGAGVLTVRYDCWPLVLDTARLNPIGELQALMEGRRTFHLIYPQMYRRHRLAIARWPTAVIGTIHREHKCGTGEVPEAHLMPKRVSVPREEPGF